MKRPEDVPHAFQSAWNSHDMEYLGALFHEDATFVNRFGHYVRGVKEIVDLHAPIHATIYSDSTLENGLIDVVGSATMRQSCTSGAASRSVRSIQQAHTLSTR